MPKPLLRILFCCCAPAFLAFYGFCIVLDGIGAEETFRLEEEAGRLWRRVWG